MAEYKKLIELMSQEVKYTKKIAGIEKEIQSLVLKEQQVTGEELGKSMSESFKIQKKIDELSLCLDVLENDVPRLILDQIYDKNNVGWNWVDSTKYKDKNYLDNSENYEKLVHTWNNIGQLSISLGTGFYDSEFPWDEWKSSKIAMRFYYVINEFDKNINIKFGNGHMCITAFEVDRYKSMLVNFKSMLVEFRKESGQILKNMVSTIIELNGDHSEHKKKLHIGLIECNEKLSNLKKQQQNIKNSLDIDPDISSDLFDDNKSEASYSFLSDV